MSMKNNDITAPMRTNHEMDRTAARLRKQAPDEPPNPTGYAPPLDSTRIWSVPSVQTFGIPDFSSQAVTSSLTSSLNSLPSSRSRFLAAR